MSTGNATLQQMGKDGAETARKLGLPATDAKSFNGLWDDAHLVMKPGRNVSTGSDLPETRANDPRDCGSSVAATP